MPDAYADVRRLLDEQEHVEISRQTGTSKPNYVEKCISCIHESYADTMLSVETIAETCGLNSSYISKLFKKEIGIGLLEYLQRYRISRAKEIIRQNPNVRIKELCESVGYANVATFIRVFKKIEGPSPGQYRDMLLQKYETE